MFIWGLFELLNKLNGYFNVIAVFMCTIRPNDIVATGEDSFYFTNSYKFDFTQELIGRLCLGNVGYYDGTKGHILLAGIGLPNSINTSPDGKYVSTLLLPIRNCPSLERNKSYGLGLLEYLIFF